MLGITSSALVEFVAAPAELTNGSQKNPEEQKDAIKNGDFLTFSRTLS